MVPLCFSELPVSPEFFLNVHIKLVYNDWRTAFEGSLPRKLPGLMCKCMQTWNLPTDTDSKAQGPGPVLYRLPALMMVPFYWCSDKQQNNQSEALNQCTVRLVGGGAPSACFSGGFSDKKQEFSLAAPNN